MGLIKVEALVHMGCKEPAYTYNLSLRVIHENFEFAKLKERKGKGDPRGGV